VVDEADGSGKRRQPATCRSAKEARKVVGVNRRYGDGLLGVTGDWSEIVDMVAVRAEGRKAPRDFSAAWDNGAAARTSTRVGVTNMVKD
jgi:hypothetical protein